MFECEGELEDALALLVDDGIEFRGSVRWVKVGCLTLSRSRCSEGQSGNCGETHDD
jgi:hypothetical protein